MRHKIFDVVESFEKGKRVNKVIIDDRADGNFRVRDRRRLDNASHDSIVAGTLLKTTGKSATPKERSAILNSVAGKS